MIKYDLNTIDENERIFFIEMLPYTSEYITQYNYSGNAVDVEIGNEKYNYEVIEKLDKLRDMINSKSLKYGAKLKPIVIFDRTGVSTLNKKPIFNVLLKSRSINEIIHGIYSYSGIFLQILNYFKMKIEEFTSMQFPLYEVIEFPTLMPISSYIQGGYFDSFPHHIMFQTLLKNDLDILTEFAEKGANHEFIQNIKTPAAILKHAACAPIYPLIATRMENFVGPSLVYYVSARCFRNEAENISELSRLNEFTMSEIVFVGKDDETRNRIQKCKKLWEFWTDTFILNCKIQTANDSFFASNYKKLKYFQLIGKSKEEFKLLLPHNGSYIACSSANYHLTHFAKKYNLRNPDGFCHTSCIAFGIERLAYALLCQKGIDPSRWDTDTYNEISKFVSIESSE